MAQCALHVYCLGEQACPCSPQLSVSLEDYKKDSCCSFLDISDMGDSTDAFCNHSSEL